jgi:peroxiredoxin
MGEGRSELELGTLANVGDEAPDFALKGARGVETALRDLRGKKRAFLIFYPKDMTSG